MNSPEIVKLLAQKHHEDVFVPECKFGPTQVTDETSGRFDAWVMLRSWANWSTIGYEIKARRSDFLRDKKWRRYLPHCHEFYFVAPKGVILPGELEHEPVGYLEVASTGTRLFTRKKAPRREKGVDPTWVFVYILMSRAAFRGEYDPASKAEYWRQFLEAEKQDRITGHEVSVRLSQAIHEREEAVMHREWACQAQERDIEAWIRTLIEWGAIPGTVSTGQLREVLRDRLNFRAAIGNAIERAQDSLDRLQKVIESELRAHPEERTAVQQDAGAPAEER